MLLAIILAALSMSPPGHSSAGGNRSSGSGTWVLNSAVPVVSLPVPKEFLSAQTHTLQLTLTTLHIANPNQAAYSVAVSLQSATSASQSLGSLGTYPTGRTGTYLLDATTALKRLRALGTNTSRLCLRLELKPLREGVSLQGLEVTLAAPKWQSGPQ